MDRKKDMSMNIIYNDKSSNHIKYLKRFGRYADKLVIVSPFLSQDMASLLKCLPNLRTLEIYTNLDGYEMAGSILGALDNAIEHCHEKNIDVSIWQNKMLHGKAYLLYRCNEEAGFIISSANYTMNGLVNNHEFGVFIDNSTMQHEMYDKINTINFSELLVDEVKYLLKKSEEFEHHNPQGNKVPVFKAERYINIKPSEKKESRCRYFLKPLGTVKNPVFEGYTIIDDNEIGLSKKNTNISKGDIFICHGVGPSQILGYCQVLTDEPKIKENDPNDRWKYKYITSCISIEYSSRWWEYDLRTFDLVEEFVSKKTENIHVTAAGGDTLGGLNFGSQLIELSKEFAEFIIDKIPTINQDKYKED